uniref:BRISC and BRCA1-A complex member 1 n=1 Tax=Kalanchoe fedtschenkoi TaxID=63787 RepID=A0A7N0SWV2_KALFE
MNMEGVEGVSAPPPRFTLTPIQTLKEDILFCVDGDAESQVEMKIATGASGRPLTRLDAIKQAILMFVNAKTTIDPNHRFAFCAIGKSVSWVRKEFNNDVDSALSALRSISVNPTGGLADLTHLFRVAAHEAKKSRAQNRLFRVILFYCRSSSPPHHQWPASQKLFTLDVVYLHDKPGPENCPQKVYDALVDALEHVSEYEAFIFESGQGLPRVLFRQVSTLLAHPQQRCVQDDLDIPKSLARKTPPADAMTGAEVIPVPSQ